MSLVREKISCAGTGEKAAWLPLVKGHKIG